MRACVRRLFLFPTGPGSKTICLTASANNTRTHTHQLVNTAEKNCPSTAFVMREERAHRDEYSSEAPGPSVTLCHSCLLASDTPTFAALLSPVV